MVSYPGDALKTGAKELLQTGLFSDLELTCGGQTYKVHKAILYTQSKYFRNLLAGDFKEATTNISKLDLPEDPAIFSAVLHYLYHFSWNDSTRGKLAAPIFAIRVYAAADFYDIAPLRQLAGSRFKEALDPQSPQIFVKCIEAVEKYIPEEVRTFWETLMPLVKTQIRSLLRNEAFKELLRENESLNFRLLAALSPEKFNDEDVMPLDVGFGRRLDGRRHWGPIAGTSLQSGWQ